MIPPNLSTLFRLTVLPSERFASWEKKNVGRQVLPGAEKKERRLKGTISYLSPEGPHKTDRSRLQHEDSA